MRDRSEGSFLLQYDIYVTTIEKKYFLCYTFKQLKMKGAADTWFFQV